MALAGGAGQLDASKRPRYDRAMSAGPTYADIEALPEHVVGEIIAGELVVSPRPTPKHAHASTGLTILVGGPYR